MKQKNKEQELRGQIVEQQKWIAEHGGNLSGYVARYGSANDPEHYGSGGESIFAADLSHLVEVTSAYLAYIRKSKKQR